MENYRKFLRKREKKRKRACEKIKRYIKYRIYVGYFFISSFTHYILFYVDQKNSSSIILF